MRSASCTFCYSDIDHIGQQLLHASVVLTPKALDLIRIAGEVKNAEVIEYEPIPGKTTDALQPGDLIPVTPQAIRRSSSVTQWRLTRALRGASVAVVAGPGRLTVSSGSSGARYTGQWARPRE